MDPQPHDVFFHIRMVMSMVTGLGVARILAGLARFVQHPGKEQIYAPHLAWSLFLLLAILHFWWFEFALSATPEWSFARYLFVVGYAVLFFFIAVLLFPDSIAEYDGFAGYFHARQAWFYGFLALLFAVDAADAAMKGSDHLAALGGVYYAREGLLVIAALALMRLKGSGLHLAVALGAIGLEVAWIALKQGRL